MLIVLYSWYDCYRFDIRNYYHIIVPCFLGSRFKYVWRNRHFATSLKMLKLWFFSVFFLTLTWLFASGVQSFNVCVCMCSSMLFSPSHSIWSSYIRDTYVCMCVIWTLGHRAFLEGFYKLFTNKIHTFSILLSLFLVPTTIRVFFYFVIVSSHAVSSPHQTSTFTRIRLFLLLLFFSLVAKRVAIFRVYKMVSICFIIMGKKESSWRIAKNTQQEIKKWGKKEEKGEEVMREVHKQQLTYLFEH